MEDIIKCVDEASREEMGKHLKKNEIKMLQTRILS